MLDILELRDKLNSLAFQDGSRRVFISRISDKFPIEQLDENPEDDQGEDDQEDEMRKKHEAIETYLHQFESELSEHGLLLERGDDDADALFAVQQLRQQSEIDFSWMAEGFRWVSIIMTATLEMVMPGILGLWLDSILGTQFLAIVGLVTGVPLGIFHLLRILRGRRGQSASL